VKDYSVRPYEAKDYPFWNTFINEAKNATFLFHRNFMEYHKDRFDDFSLMIFDKEKLVAVLPANRVGDTVFSHQGLTYGGLIYSDKLKLATVLTIFQSVLKFLNEIEINTINIKLIPSIYHTKPAEELLYALFLVDSKLYRRDSLSVVDLMQKNKLNQGRLEGVNKGINNGLVVKEETNLSLFWNQILTPNLEQRYGVKPVHTLQEMENLRTKFPKNIRQFNVYLEDKIVAGTTIFESNQVAHAQYISANESKNELGSLDFLYHHLLTEFFKDKKYFDFGISNENQGKNLNNGLCFWKESFGASTIVQDFYEVKTSNYILLDNVIL
jgi:hypothetical protein